MKVYTITELSMIGGCESNRHWAAGSLIKAQRIMAEAIADFEKDNNIDTNGSDDYVIDRSESDYECYIEEFYNDFHYWIQINELEVI